jgi:hypothetical protein
MKKSWVIFIYTLLCLPMLTLAETGNDESLATLMRSNGKIYVVVAVMLTILIGLILYLISLDRKISKLEKED